VAQVRKTLADTGQGNGTSGPSIGEVIVSWCQ
jgi:hypothetical protein